MLIGGDVRSSHYTNTQLFGINTPIKFFILSNLRTFNAILENDTLKELDVIRTKFNYMLIQNKIKIPLKQLVANQLYSTNIKTEHMDSEQREKIKNLIKKYKTLCADPDAKLTFTTRVVATIRTNSETLTCNKFYAYPIALKEEVEG